MPRWKDLPDGLAPEVGQLVHRLRRLVDDGRPGDLGRGADGALNPAVLADLTGYGRASWERYLNGLLLAPKGAVVALAEVAGEDPAPLVALWERAERAWSRAALGADSAAQAVRLSRPPTAPTAPTASVAAAPARARRRPALFVTGVVGVVGVVVGAFLLTGGGPADPARTAPAASSPSAPPSPRLPPGVRCAGADCTGRDPEAMGCSGPRAVTTRDITVGTRRLEIRYSADCGAAWGRLTQAGPGDTVKVRATGAARQTATLTAVGDTIAYTPMVAVDGPGELTACVVPAATGAETCTS
ncbi:DUF2690 domain-containing protein [Streptomyces sp. NPDC086091]|uniref:DUF2690 domain-containing protein n=1 Tax=Streptomyces sp. NPDC086091 TaxID=3365751 RepID=UPI0038137824